HAGAGANRIDGDADHAAEKDEVQRGIPAQSGAEIIAATAATKGPNKLRRRDHRVDMRSNGMRLDGAGDEPWCTLAGGWPWHGRLARVDRLENNCGFHGRDAYMRVNLI